MGQLKEISWSFYLALRYLFPKGKCASFFTLLSILGIALGVTVLWVVPSVINGFGYQIRQKLVEINGHIQITSPELIGNVEALEHKLKTIKGIKGITPFALGMTLVQHNNLVAFPWIRGIEFNKALSVLPLKQFLKAGSFSGGILLSHSLAESLSVKIGDYLDVYSPLMLGALKRDEVLLPKECKVVGIFETGWAEVDRQTLLCDLQIVQELYGLGKSVHGFALSIDDKKFSVQGICEDVNRLLSPPLKASSWLELNEDLLFVLQMEKTMMLFVILFIVLVASFSVSSGLMISVVRKKREIALLTLLGAEKIKIVSIFIWQSFILGVLGIIFGFAFGAIALAFRNNILAFLSHWFLPKDMLWNFYSFAQLPAKSTAGDALIIALTTLCIAVSAALIPAWHASRLKSSEVLRGE